MAKVIIRKANKDDFEAVYPLFQQLQPKEPLAKEKVKYFYDELIESDKHFAWVALINNRLVGYIDVVFRTYHFAFGFTARIETTIVDEKFRRQGIATKLIECCEEKAKEKGCKVVELDSGLPRESAHQFYESRGYAKRGFLFWKKL